MGINPELFALQFPGLPRQRARSIRVSASGKGGSMKQGFSIVTQSVRPELFGTGCVSLKAAESAAAFHRSLPCYAPTPLEELPALARSLGVEQILVKDESRRFGLNAFKGLGGSYAIAGWLCRTFGLELNENTFAQLQSPSFRDRLKEITFVTATDGNHGRGVAWAAQVFGCRAVVYLPKGSARERLDNILALGADAEITGWNYDDTVRFAEETARKKGWVLIQDTAWPGYEDIPADIMGGYTTLAWETERQRTEQGWEVPTHLFLQAGVGSFAGAMAGYFSALWKEKRPRIIVVEPDQADCLYQTAKAADGALHAVTGPMNSMMAGLCCGEPCTLGWEILRDRVCGFISCDDETSALGMRLLGKPGGGDPLIVSGESGAVPLGAAARLLLEPDLAAFREALGLDARSRILVISTEEDTGRENYQRILG